MDFRSNRTSTHIHTYMYIIYNKKTSYYPNNYCIHKVEENLHEQVLQPHISTKKSFDSKSLMPKASMLEQCFWK